MILGFLSSVNQASFKALKQGLVNSGSVMMPCDFIDDVGETLLLIIQILI